MSGKSNINRRKFIQTAALAAGVSTISPIIPAVLSPTDPQVERYRTPGNRPGILATALVA